MGRVLIPTPGVYSAAIPLGKGSTVNYLVFFDGTSISMFRVYAQHTLHYTHIKSHHTLRKSRPLWPAMIDDIAPTHERWKLVKTYQSVLPQKRTVVADVCGKTYSKNAMKRSRKTVTDVINTTK